MAWYDNIIQDIVDSIQARLNGSIGVHNSNNTSHPNLERVSNKVTSLTSSDTEYPSSKCVKDAIDEIIHTGVIVDDHLDDTSTNPVQNKVIKAAIDGKVNISSIAGVVEEGNSNPVSSEAVYAEMLSLKNTLTEAGVLNKQTSISLDTPASLVYTDFSLTGVLYNVTDNKGLNGAVVELLVDDSVVGSAITDSVGGFMFTDLTGVHAGNHTFQVRYAGHGELYRNCISSSVNYDISRETSVLNLISPVDSTEYSSSDNITFNGTLKDDDDNPISNAIVKIYNSDTLLASVNTDNNGVFNTNIKLNEGDYNISVIYEGTTDYTNSTVSVSISVVEPPYILIETDSIRYFNQSVNFTPVTGKSIIVDWGDGTTSTVTNYMNKSYSNYSVRRIKVYNVASLGDSCFSSCSNLASVTIPSSVTSLGDYCFSYCSNLASVTIPSSVTSLGDSCFSYCSNLASVTIPSSVTSLGDYCFSSCYNLASVTIPSSVTSLGDYCFSSCSNLASVTIPSSVTSLGDSCFSYCYNLASVTLEYTGSNIPPATKFETYGMVTVYYTIPTGEQSNYTAQGYSNFANTHNNGVTYTNNNNEITLTFDSTIWGNITGKLYMITSSMGAMEIDSITSNTITFTLSEKILLLYVGNNNTPETFITYDSMPDYIRNYDPYGGQ